MRTPLPRGHARAWITALVLLCWSAASLGAPWLLPAPDLDLRSSGEVTRILPLPGGGAFVAGRFYQVDGERRNLRLAKLRPDGSLDTEWSPPGVFLNDVYDMVLDDTGHVFVAGNFGQGLSFSARVLKFSVDGAGAVPPA